MSKQGAGSQGGTPNEGAPGYRVMVDDNYHYQDASERYTLGSFATCAEADAACRRIVEEWLRAHYRRGMTADALWKLYVGAGEDPFIVSPGPTCKFSAWDYARQRCQELARK